MNKVLIAILVPILSLGLMITGCSPSAPQVGRPAPDFQLPNLARQSVSLSDLRGKPIFINFWASWCGPCRAEMPFIQAIFDDEELSGEGLVILTINIGESSSTAKSFMESLSLSFPVLLDTSGEVAQKYKIRAIPTTFLVGKDGIIKAIKFGAFTGKADIEKYLSKIIP